MNKKIIILLAMVSALFLSLAVYLTFFGVFKAPELEKSVYNQRSYKMEEKIRRGTIYDRNGEILAKSDMTDEGQKRVYPYGKLYTQVVGYSSHTYGKSKVELSYNEYLSGSDKISTTMNIMGSISGEQSSGLDVTLTLDHKLQQYASDVLGNKKGAVVVMDAESGAIRALVSNPTFNPTEEALEKNWASLAEDESAPFVARATSGMYAPGSTWKIITAAAAIEAGMEDEEYDDTGKTLIGGREYTNSKGKAYGKVNLSEAFLHSSNVVFATIGDKLGKEGLSIYDRFLLGKAIDFDISAETPLLSDSVSSMSKTDIASTAIGQGKLMVTPLYMTMVASAIANGGEMLKPYLVEDIGRKDISVYKGRRESLGRPITSSVAYKIKDMMRLCVTEGTGGQANVSGITVYGKTGTAQNERDKSHDWFVGFGENGEECAVICVMMEYNGQGSGVPSAMAGKILSFWLNK